MTTACHFSQRECIAQEARNRSRCVEDTDKGWETMNTNCFAFLASESRRFVYACVDEAGHKST